ncbi:squalene cyclase [Bradyrhizobium sp. 190]|uniref:squalene cyclase n=1 Tax=Bradyrhizobium sp. 190 TaxID=2782658 RepID=UPI001FF905F4|nr:squalene cyclase [Bradyrhizobium sp. 190]MCK1517862.1 squalene cyclase [Bradyrhizobium sp. 190]
MTAPSDVTDWLLDSDPSIRWQVMRDLVGALESGWAAERAKIESVGWGAKLLALQDADGQWAGGSFVPRGFTLQDWKKFGQPWTATTYSLSQLREFGLDPSSDRAKRIVELVGLNSRWDEGGQPYWEGEVEECINGRTVADGAYFGVDVSSIVVRLLGERLHDGGWNCERANGSGRSSFHTTINVLEGLLEYEKATGGTPASREARRSGEAYLLERNLFRRRSTGEPADEQFLRFLHPNGWRYDVLRALDYCRSSAMHTGATPDPRLAEAISHVRSKRLADGTWPLDWIPAGQVWFQVDAGPGKPSKWVTLRAMRVLKWWEEQGR